MLPSWFARPLPPEEARALLGEGKPLWKRHWQGARGKG
jgi:hypothetical protein